MKKPFALILCLCVMAFLLTGCTGQGKLTGSYVALNPPVDSGEMVIKQLTFAGDKVTLIAGDVQQTVGFKLSDGIFTLQTDYGKFDYAFEQKSDGTLVIDGVTYQKQ